MGLVGQLVLMEGGWGSLELRMGGAGGPGRVGGAGSPV